MATTRLAPTGIPASPWLPGRSAVDDNGNYLRFTRHGPAALPGSGWGSFTKGVAGSRGYAGQFTRVSPRADPGQPWGQFSGRVSSDNNGRVGIAAIPFTRLSPQGVPSELWGSFLNKTSVGFETDIPGKIVFLSGGSPTISQQVATGSQTVVDIPALALSQLFAFAPQIQSEADVIALIVTADITPFAGAPTVRQVDFQPAFIPMGVVPLIATAPDIHQREDRHHWQEEQQPTDTWTRKNKASDAWTRKPKRV